MDYGKYRYELSKKQQEAKKKQAVVEVKEIKLRPKTEKHDLDFKIRNIRKFLQQKNKVKVTLRFRGREIVYANSLGRDVLNKVGEAFMSVIIVILWRDYYTILEFVFYQWGSLYFFPDRNV